MMKVNFFDVGQGDSISIEWENDDGTEGIAIIDCNLVSGKNVIIEYLKEKEIKQIDYIILSHPHHDHYSGILSLLEYCFSKQIVIKHFLHTCKQVPDFILAATTSPVEQNELFKLFGTLKSKSKEINIACIQANGLTDTFFLNEKLEVKILSPSFMEEESYNKNALPKILEEEAGCDPNANFLSSVITISNVENDWSVLLTSDCMSRSLRRIKKAKLLNEKRKVVLAQSPHHGSKHNHYSNFWKPNFFNKSDLACIVFSVGVNSYGHPNDSVYDFFLKEGFNIFSTMNIRELKEAAPKRIDVSSYFDAFGLIKEESENEGIPRNNQFFKINDQGIISKETTFSF